MKFNLFVGQLVSLRGNIQHVLMCKILISLTALLSIFGFSPCCVAISTSGACACYVEAGQHL